MHDQNLRGRLQDQNDQRSRRRAERMSRRNRHVSTFDVQGRREFGTDHSATSGAGYNMDLGDNNMADANQQRRPRGRPSNAERERRRQ